MTNISNVIGRCYVPQCTQETKAGDFVIWTLWTATGPEERLSITRKGAMGKIPPSQPKVRAVMMKCAAANLLLFIDNKRKNLYIEEHTPKPFTSDKFKYFQEAQERVKAIYEELQKPPTSSQQPS